MNHPLWNCLTSLVKQPFFGIDSSTTRGFIIPSVDEVGLERLEHIILRLFESYDIRVSKFITGYIILHTSETVQYSIYIYQ
jgi:hypothetical protein